MKCITLGGRLPMLLSRNEWLSLAAPFSLVRFTSSLTLLAAEEGESEEENDFFF